MSASAMTESPPATQAPLRGDGRKDNIPDVVVYIEAGRDATALISHAEAVAAAFNANVLLVSVIEPPVAGIPAVDPVDWDIRRREVTRHLADLAKEFRSETRDIRVKVLEGQPAEQICNCVIRRSDDIVVVLRESGAGRWTSGEAASGAMISDADTILAIPAELERKAIRTYGRVFVPLDGSANAESAIPKAATLAKAHGGELLICHVTPEPVMTEIGPTDSETIRLKEAISRHNERVARGYLNRVEDRLNACGVPVSTRLLSGGDARRSLVATIEREAADIVVMASHGHSGHADVSAGDVAGFILDRSSVPVLVTRRPRGRKDKHIVQDVRPEGTRRPADPEQ